MTVEATRAPKNRVLSTVVLGLAVEHVARCTDDGTKNRIGAEDRGTHRACAAAQDRLFARRVPASGKARAGCHCHEEF